MSGLFDVWYKTQMEMPDGPLLLKTAEGHQVPITKQQLMRLIAETEPGSEFTVGGMSFRIGLDGESIAVVSTSPHDSMPDNAPAFSKSASQQRKQALTFGDALLAQYRANDRKRSL